MRTVSLLALLAVMLPFSYAEDEKADAPESEKKAESKDKAPDFTLRDISGKEHSLADFKGKWVVLEWTNRDCPFVKKHYDANNMQALQKKYTGKGAIWLSICSSAKGKQGHLTKEEWEAYVKDKGIEATAILLDADGKVGHLYNAKNTPFMLVIDPKGEKVYEGAIDSERTAFKPEDIAKAKNYVAAVLDAGMAGKEIEVKKTDAYG